MFLNEIYFSYLKIQKICNFIDIHFPRPYLRTALIFAFIQFIFKVRLPVKKVCKLFTMSYEVLTRDYSVRFWRSKCLGIQSFQHFNLLKFCTCNYAPLESSDLHAPGTSDLIGFSVPCILPTMLCFFVLI